jgi:hypothetical protein
MAKNKITGEKLVVQRRRLLYILIFTLIFEGLVRKLLPPVVGVAIFFLKDLLCLIALLSVLKVHFRGRSERLSRYWRIVFFAIIPVLIFTGFHETLLIFFGLKQYLLYVVVGLLVPLAFPPGHQEEFKRFVAIFVYTLIPTTIIAVLQNSLPPSHWLNLSVGGDSLEKFSAGGYLRVSSTFSFSGQYEFYLNVVCSFLGARFFLEPKFKWTFLNNRFVRNYITIISSVLLLIGAFITGGRTAVLGCAACLIIGVFFAGIKSPKLILGKGLVMFVVMLVALTVLQQLKPEFFAAYNKRSEDTKEYSSSNELYGRVEGNFFGWTNWAFVQDFSSLLFGNGLGVMSNGSDKVSSYAASVRANGFWTEADLPTTVWEGGLYLLLVWYGFRLSIIIFCFKMWLSTKTKIYAFSTSFLMGIVIVDGVFGTISIQPPLAIWWWLSVGAIIAIAAFDQEKVRLNQQQTLKQRALEV